MSDGRFVNDSGVKQSPTWLRGGSGGSGGGNSSSGSFSDIIKGVGSLFDMVEQRKSQDLANKISIEQSEATGNLRESLSTPTSNPTGGEASTTNQDTQELERRFASVEQGKMSRTQFNAWSSARMRTMINENPERAYEIRETYKRVTGYDPDVKYREQVQAEQAALKTEAQKKEDEWKRDKDEASKLGIPAQVILKGDADLTSRTQIKAEILNRQSQNATIGREKKNLEINTARRTAGANDAFDLANREIDTELNNLYSDSFKAVVGFSFNDINKRVQSATADGRVTPQEMAELQQMFTTFKQAAQVRVDKLLNNPFGDDKRSYAARIGDQNKIKELKQRAMGRITDIEEAIVNKDFGLIGYNKALIEAQEQSDQLSVLQSPQGEALRKLKLIPKEAIGLYLGQGSNLSDLDKNTKSIQLDSSQTVRVGQVASDINSGRNLKDSLKDNTHKDPAKNAQVVNKATTGATQQLILKETTPAQAAKLAESLFTDKGGNFMESLNTSSKQMVFKNLTAPQVQARIQELAKTNPEIAGRYNAWALSSGANILKQETDTIKEYLRPPQGILERFSTGSKPLGEVAGVTFNGKQFIIDPLVQSEVQKAISEGANTPSMAYKSYSIRSWYDNAQASITKVNEVLNGILPMAIAAGEDPRVVVQTLFSDPEILKMVRTAPPSENQERGGEMNLPQTVVAPQATGVAPEAQTPPVASVGAPVSPPVATKEVTDRITMLENDAKSYEKSNPRVAEELKQRAQALKSGQTVIQGNVEVPASQGQTPRGPVESPEEGPGVASLGASQTGVGGKIRGFVDGARVTVMNDAQISARNAENKRNPNVDTNSEDVRTGNRRANTAKDSGQASNTVADVLMGKARDPVVEQHLRNLSDAGLLTQAASEEALKSMSAVKERRAEESGDNFAIRYRPSQRARQSFRNIDVNSLPGGTKGLLDFIAIPESGGDYNMVFRGIKPPKPLTEMTVGQVLEFQQGLRQNGAASTASGRYQFIFKTLTGLVQQLGIDRNEKFDESMQDRLAIRLLQQRGLDKFQKGQIDEDTFIRNLSMEWAGLPNTTGKSFYAGDGLNKSGVPLAQVRAVTKRLRGEQGPNQ